MKTVAALAFAGFSLIASLSAAQAADNHDPLPVTEYTYGTKLDIAKVVNVSPIPDVCGVVPAFMTYIDHQGVEHKLQYEVMGNGCSQS